ncbi:zinc finger BED domain-containing protein 6-like [Nematolebias whitei]|uniref:zinc finger BED domain-containing protein 6-like n=1 Tax=Nematolebias whitei TaxID=451745 RepID=UPI00189BDFB5|nr:zinc finger BED domain-containing protein 6-like [Nematolebias whitei]
MSSKSAVIKFGYLSHKEYVCKTTLKKKHTAQCKFCSASLSETVGTTSNFYRHLERKHKERFLEYKAGQQNDVTVTQPSISLFTQKVQLYSPQSPRQQAISQAIVQDLIIGCCLPLSLVENSHFKHFLEVMDSKYTPISRKTVSDRQIPELVIKVKETVLEKLKTQSSVSLTTDLWSDRRLRSFLGVTAHVCYKSKDSYALESYLLDCRRFTGRHTGEHIASAFEEITEEYGIHDKISYIITDNAANMKCAFKVHMPQSDDSESEEEHLDDEHLWEDINSQEDTELPWSSGARLSCFAHSLQLVVNDGMKEVKAISHTIAKTSRFTTLLHSSSQFKDKFEATFGTNRTIPAANTTRWNSIFKQVQAFTALDHKALNEMCSKDHEELVFSAREWNQLKELSAVLAPFSEVTDLTEGEKSVTISMVVPTVLDLNTHLLKMEDTRMQCQSLVRALQQSLVKRFSGIFLKTSMAKDSGREEPFNHNVYFLATMLDPQFGLSWVDLDVTNGGNSTSVKKFRDELKKTLTGQYIFSLLKINVLFAKS